MAYVIRRLLFGSMIFWVRWSSGAPLEAKTTLDAREWQGFVNDLRESWTSPIMYLQKRGYLPKGNDHLLEEKISELQKENVESSEFSGGDADKSALANISGRSYTDFGSIAGISNASDTSSSSGSANSVLDSSSGSANNMLDGTGSSAMDDSRILYSTGGIDGLPSSAFDFAKSFDVAPQGDKNTPIEYNGAPMSSIESLANGQGNPGKKTGPQKQAQLKPTQPKNSPKLQGQKQQGQQHQTQQQHQQQTQQQHQQQTQQQQQPRRPPGFLKKIRDKFAGLFSSSKKAADANNNNRPAYNFDFSSDFDRDLLNDLNIDGNSLSANSFDGKPAGQRDFSKALDLKRYIMNTRDTTANDYNAKDLNTRELAINDLPDFASSAWKDAQEQRDYSMRDLDLRNYNVKDFDPKDLGAQDTFDFSASGVILKDAPARDFDMRDLGIKDYTKDFGESHTLLKDYNTNLLGTKEIPLNNYNGNDASSKEFNAKDTDLKDYSLDNAAGKDFSLGDLSLKEQHLRDVNSADPSYLSSKLLTRSSARSDNNDYEKLLDRNVEKDREFTKAVLDEARKNAMSHESVQSSSINE